MFLALFVALLWRAGPHLFLQADPLVAVLNALSTRALYRGLLWALVILIPTFFLGRFFCGWICPLGTLNHLCSRKKRGRARMESNRYQPWQRFKYYLLAGGLAAAVFGSAALGWLDPIALAVRSFALAVLPAGNYPLGLALKQPHFRQALLFAALLAAILAANLWFTRFWCRALCPLGALLGLASRYSLLRLEKRVERCGDCNRCLLNCQGGDDPIPGARWRRPECHLCLNCVADCPEGGLAFRFGSQPEGCATPDLRRRSLVTGLAAGAAAVPLFRVGAQAEQRGRLIRPPGALDEPAFLARCIRCGECMRACPTNALQPALLEGGAEGLWTPVLVARTGYCQSSCVACGDVCPTGAIRPFTVREKGWQGEAAASRNPIRIGTAFYDRGRCLPWAMATECIVCEEWCPTSPKAVYLRQAAPPEKLRQPYIDPDRCVGCGACEYACPVKDRAAVYVTSVGESRSPANQFRLAARTGPALPESGEAAGWVKTGATRAFEAAHLWQYLDGGADRYLKAGLVRTLTARYRYRDRFDAVADLHTFQSSAGAAALFDSEPAAGGRTIPLGDGARLYRGSLLFRKGASLGRIVAYDAETGEALLELARAMEKRC